MKINFTGSFFKDESLVSGICALAPDYDFIPVFNEPADITLKACHGEANQLTVRLSNKNATIIYDKKIHFSLIKYALKCNGKLVIVPMQDLLGLDSNSSIF